MSEYWSVSEVRVSVLVMVACKLRDSVTTVASSGIRFNGFSLSSACVFAGLRGSDVSRCMVTFA